MPPLRVDAETGEVITDFNPDEWESVSSGPTRIDAETGAPISDFNPDEWEKVTPAGWGETLGRSALAAFYGLGRSAVGALKAGQDAVSQVESQHPWAKPIVRMNPFGGAMAALNYWAPDFAAETSQMGKGLIDEQRQALNVPRGSAKDVTFDVASEAVPDIALAGAGFATGQPAPVIASVMGLRSLGRKYNELSDLNANTSDALTGALASGAVDTVANILPVSKALNASAGPVKRALTAGATNALINAPQAALDMAITDAATPVDFSPEDYLRAAGIGAGTGAVVGTSMGLVGAAVDAVRKPKLESPGIASAIESEAALAPPPEPLGLPAPEGKIYGPDFVAQDPSTLSPSQIEAAKVAATKADALAEADVKARIENLSKPGPEKQQFPSPIEVVESRARGEADIATASKILTDIEADKTRRAHLAKADDIIERAPNKSPYIDSTEAKGSFEPPVKSTKIDTSGDVRAALRDRIASERGHAQILNDIIEGTRHYSELIKKTLKEDPEFKGVPKSENKLRGLRGFLGKFIDNPVEYGERAGPNGIAVSDAMLETPRTQAQNLHDFGKSLKPFTDLPDKSRVGAIARELRRYAAKMVAADQPVPKFSDEQIVSIASKSPEFINSPITPAEIAGLRALYNTMDGVALERLREALKARAQNLPDVEQTQAHNLVDQYINGLKGKYYVPFNRPGDFYVTAKDELGNTVVREHFARKGEALVARDKLRASGRFQSIEAGELPIQSQLFKEQGLHPSLNPMLDPRAFAEAARGNNKGFLRHLLGAALTEGESPDIEGAVGEYLAGLARWHAISSQEPKINAGLKALELENKALSAQKLHSIWTNWKKPTNKAVATWNQLVHMWFIAATPASAIANSSQIPVRIIPGVFREVGINKGTAITRRATTSTIRALYSLARGSSKLSNDKELSQALTKFIERGGTGNTVMSEFADMRRGLLRKPTIEKGLYSLFNYAEKANNIYGFFAGYDIAKSRGLRGPEAYAYAEKFNGDVNLIQNDFGRPTALASPVGKVVGQYKNYQVQLLKTFLKDVGGTLKGDRRAALALAMQTAAYMVLGGTSAALGGSALRVLSSLGINVPTLIEDKAGDLADWINYGAFARTFNISPAVSTQELVPDIYNDPRLAVANSVLGAGGQFLLNQGVKAYDIATRWDNPRLAAETLAPRFIRNASRAERWASEGKLRDFRNGILVDRPPTTSEVLQLLGGAPPIALTKEYQKKAARRSAVDAAESVSNLNYKLAKALIENDNERFDRLIESAMETGQSPDVAAIRDQVIAQSSKEGGEYIERKRVPKRLRSLYDDVSSIYLEK